MFDWMSKRDPAPDADPPEPAASEAETIDWPARLQAAAGDDTALLALAREDAPVDVRVAAIGALTGEAALKLAEREHRGHDRRIHRLAKQRHLAQVALRETGDEAARLIEAARGLVGQELVPVNRLVELDRAWQGLNLVLLDAAQRAEFDVLLTQLATLTRERGDQALRIDRWMADARRALGHLRATCSAAAQGTQERGRLGPAAASVQAVVDAAPDEDACAALRDALRSALQTGAELDQCLAVLDALLEAPSAAPSAASPWLELPPLADADLAEAMNRRFEQWQQAWDQAHQARQAEQRERARERELQARSKRTGTLAAELEMAEAALAAGHLADTHKHLLAVDQLLHGGTPAATLRSRIDGVQAEYSRLKGWQHWGGGLARDELVLQAEALAAATLGEPGADIRKLSIRQQAEVIDDLRARWKELDRLGGATSRALWQRFDAALKVAYGPVASHLETQRAARAQNLQSRDRLLDALNAVALPGLEPESALPDWKALAAALERFQTEWRKLGPLEHTVPHKERPKLVERMAGAVQRLEAPLSEARRGAQVQREQLVARAKALAADAGAGALGRDWIGKVRELQAEWQHRATVLPLGRAAENALWSRFKAEIDTIFSARDAAASARDAELKAHGAERVALIERLAAVADDTSPAEIKRTLAEVDARWQRAGPAPRADAAALDARFRNAREAVRRLLATHAERSWNAVCDALLAKLALCAELESGAGTAETTLAQRWAALAVLPGAWEQALAWRASLLPAPPGGSTRPAAADELLLQLEAAFQLASPPALETARRELKFRALKAALEGRPSAAPAPLAPESLLAAALGCKALDGPQRDRLERVIAAVRQRGPAGAG